MRRYGFLGFTGFMVMGAGLMNGAGVWMIPLAAPVMFDLLLGWNWLMAAGVVAYAGYRVWSGDPGWYDGVFVFGWAMMLISSNARCPRCGLSVGISDGTWRHSAPPQHCIGCGRNRRDVWPFQYVLKPEPWDGQYHDEGGGPAPEGFRAEVIRRHVHDQWIKKKR
ncbi:hypothetical protein ABAC460_19740 [Asticcacaulis sp. AC460]|uniref:hypothetical protein n=1 Tax=Asticcacaulis sp. AC460 TaxID=1282360 RepID=UPI0003C3D4CB|nr:hypothetical protein [Asticcacaulis sp. AC460]ESQ87561.1 hypothetical protein ABAC460_19740 [Asticcacaulis sp. AC460]